MRTFRKHAQYLAAILMFLIASGTYVFAEELSDVGIFLQVYEKNIMWVYPEIGQTFKRPGYEYFEYFVSPLPDSPAKRAGMPKLAKLIAIDGREVDSRDPDMVVRRIQEGPAGSAVVLRVLVEEKRDGVFGRYLKEYTLIRERTSTP